MQLSQIGARQSRLVRLAVGRDLSQGATFEAGARSERRSIAALRARTLGLQYYMVNRTMTVDLRCEA